MNWLRYSNPSRLPRLRAGEALYYGGSEKDWDKVRFSYGSSWETTTIDKHTAKEGVFEGSTTLRLKSSDPFVRFNVFRTPLGAFYAQKV